MDEVRRTAEIAAIFSNELRLLILKKLLENSLIVNELVMQTGKTQAVISKQLGILKTAKIIKCCPNGRCRKYSLTDPDNTRQILESIENLKEKIQAVNIDLEQDGKVIK